jgi:hypothetical protein
MIERLNVGPMIGQGAQHRVAESTDHSDCVVKWPHGFGQHWDASTVTTVLRDKGILEGHAVSTPEFRVVDNPVIAPDDGGDPFSVPYAVVMERIGGRILRERDLHDPDILAQFDDLLAASIAIRHTYGAALDFVGGESLPHFLRYFIETQPGQLGAYNLRILEGRVVLLDTNLLDPARSPYPVVGPAVVNGLVDLQHTLVSRMTGDPTQVDLVARTNKFKSVTAAGRLLFNSTRPVEWLKRNKLQDAPRKLTDRD